MVRVKPLPDQSFNRGIIQMKNKGKNSQGRSREKWLLDTISHFRDALEQCPPDGNFEFGFDYDSKVKLTSGNPYRTAKTLLDRATSEVQYGDFEAALKKIGLVKNICLMQAFGVVKYWHIPDDVRGIRKYEPLGRYIKTMCHDPEMLRDSLSGLDY